LTMASGRRERRERAPESGNSSSPASGQQIATVSIIGAGRMGTALALALSRCGYDVEAMVARRKSHARRASGLLSKPPLALSSDELERLPPSNILFITTPDDRIGETAARIASLTTHESSSKRTALHTSGALSSDELKSLRGVGYRTGSMHPLLAVSDARAGAESLSRAFFCIEGERGALVTARAVVRHLGARSFSIKTAQKALYHAAAVTASGHMVALFDVASEMLARCGLDDREARAILMPLVRSTLHNLSEHEPARALTGTFARADVETVRRHLRAIDREKLRDALSAYTLLGRRSLRLAREGGADERLLEEIAKALAEASEA
jgi:predicted short-subunit dehydrogenase-like oxidoreductase (DUF2520 family)